MELELDIECPDCKKSFKEKFKNVSPGKSKKCPSCGDSIKFEGDDLNKIQNEINKALDGLRNIKIEIRF